MFKIQILFKLIIQSFVQNKMFKLPQLPFPKDAFQGVISEECFEFHHGKHHRNYVDKLNELIKGTQWQHKSLDDIVMKCKDQKIFNNGGQHWNHTFFWYCMTPDQIEPTGPLKDSIVKRWGSVSKCLQEFSKEAVENFGSGWTWLVKKGDDIAIVNTSNAGNPLVSGYQPLFTLDVWEHAYYIDYRNLRKKYVENVAKHINWKFVEGNFMADKVSIKL